MKNLILIKLGGSVITDKTKPFTAKKEVIRRLARELKKARGRLKNTDIVIGHGSGSFGHTIASRYQTQLGNIGKDSLRGFCLTSEAAVDINRIVLKEFLRQGLPAVSFSPMSGIYKNEVFLAPILKCLELELIPLLYGDVVFDAGRGFIIYSCEKVLDVLVKSLRKNYKKVRIIQCGDTDGVYDGEGRTIPAITPKNFSKVKRWIGGAKGTDVTGGMIHKVEESLSLARKYKIPTIIINGNKKGNLLKAIWGKEVLATCVGVCYTLKLRK